MDALSMVTSEEVRSDLYETGFEMWEGTLCVCALDFVHLGAICSELQ